MSMCRVTIYSSYAPSSSACCRVEGATSHTVRVCWELLFYKLCNVDHHQRQVDAKQKVVIMFIISSYIVFIFFQISS